MDESKMPKTFTIQEDSADEHGDHELDQNEDTITNDK